MAFRLADIEFGFYQSVADISTPSVLTYLNTLV
jgi:hypothetical protein